MFPGSSHVRRPVAEFKTPDPPGIYWGGPQGTHRAGNSEDEDSDTVTRTRKKTQKPRRWKVLLLNDDFTTMEFVIYVLMKHFNKTQAEATHIMLHIHHKGVGVCGLYPRDIAETKAAKVVEEARDHSMPLMCTTEPE